MVILDVGSLKAPFKGLEGSPEPREHIDLEDVSEDDWEIAQSRLDIISPLLALRRRCCINQGRGEAVLTFTRNNMAVTL